MDVKEFTEKLNAANFDDIYEFTSVEYSTDPDFSFYECAAASRFNAGFDLHGLIANTDPFYRVCVTVRAAPGSEFHFEVWLPEKTWNGRIFTLGNGGAGMCRRHAGLIACVQKGFVAVQGVLGIHPNEDGGINNPAVWADFGWRATHAMAFVGKRLTELFYGEKPKYSYYHGFSTGGQQGISTAEKFPKDFDGIIAGAPAISRTCLHIFFQWKAYNLIRREGTFVISAEEAKVINEITMAYFQARGDGAPGDTFITNPSLTEEEKEDVLTLIQQTGLFSDEQMQALRNIYRGPINPRTGERIYCGFPMGAEDSNGGPKRYATKGYEFGFLYPMRWGMDTPFDQYDWRTFDYDKDIDRMQKMVKDLNADTAELDEFKKRGGKMIMFAGTGDAIIPQANVSNFYNRVVQKQGGLEETRKFFRYFLIPGLDHGSRYRPNTEYFGTDELGPASGAFDDEISIFGLGYWNGLFKVIMDWVEKDIVPDNIIATGFNKLNSKGKPDIEAGVKFQRPVYSYPDETVYIGGDPALPTSFTKKEGGLFADEPRAERYW